MGLGDHVQVDLCDVVTSTGEPTADGATWLVPGEIDGWDSADARDGSLTPTGRHGLVVTSNLFGARELSVPICVSADTREEAWAAFYRATGRMPALGSEGRLVVYEDVVKWLTVTRAGRPIISSPVNGEFEGTIPLRATYPFKRALDPVTVSIDAGTAGAFTAAGNAPAEIEVTTTTAGTVELSIAGLTLRTSSVPAGTVLTSGPGFDNPERTIVGPAGENLFGTTLSPMQWPAVVPGDNAPVNGGTADLDLKFYPTYS